MSMCQEHAINILKNSLFHLLPFQKKALFLVPLNHSWFANFLKIHNLFF